MIIIFGSAGVLGQSISDLLLEKFNGLVLMTANHSLEDIAIYEKKYPAKVVIRKCDVSNPGDVEQVFKHVDSLGIKITGIVNNFAFTFSDSGNHNFSAQTEEVRKVFDVNYFGLASVLESTVNWAIKNKVSGLRVVNILSNSLKTLNASNGHYIASKSAVETLTRYYAKHYSEYLSVNCVAPGPVKTKLAMAVHTQDIIDAYHDAIPLNRYGTENEIANAIYFLASEKASYITGQILAVDGGFEATGVGLPSLRK